LYNPFIVPKKQPLDHEYINEKKTWTIQKKKKTLEYLSRPQRGNTSINVGTSGGRRRFAAWPRPRTEEEKASRQEAIRKKEEQKIDRTIMKKQMQSSTPTTQGWEEQCGGRSSSYFGGVPV